MKTLHTAFAHGVGDQVAAYIDHWLATRLTDKALRRLVHP